MVESFIFVRIYCCKMKLSGIIVVVLALAASCQKEDIRPNGPASSTPVLRVFPIEDPGTLTGDPNISGGIVDPNTDTDASTAGKKGK